MAADHAYPLDMALCTYASLLSLRYFRRWRAYFRRGRAYVGYEKVGVEGFFVVFRPDGLLSARCAYFGLSLRYFRRGAPTFA